MKKSNKRTAAYFILLAAVGFFLAASLALDIPFGITSFARIVFIIMAALMFGLKGSVAAIFLTAAMLLYYSIAAERGIFIPINLVALLNYLVIGVPFGIAKDTYVKQRRDILGHAEKLNQANADLCKANELLDTILDTLPALIYVKDKDLRFLKVTKFYKNRVKKESKDIIGKTDFDLYPQEAASKMRKDDQEVLHNNKPKYNIEEHLFYPGKGYIWQIANKVPLHGKEGEVVGILGITYDVTELKNMHVQLETLIDNFPYSAWLKDHEGRFLAVNRLFVRSLSKSKEEIIGKRDFDILPKELALKYRNDDREIMRDKKEKTVIESISLDGQELYETFKTPVINEVGQVIGTAGYTKSLSEINKNLVEIKRLNNLLDSIIDNAPTMLFLKDAKELKFRMVNKATEEITGLTRDEMIGKNDYDFFPPSEAEYFTQKDRAILKNKDIIDIAEESIHAKEGKKILRTKKIPILDGEGQPEYILGISEEITKQKEMEKMIKNLAYYDDITGLANRNLFKERLRFAIEIAKRNKKKLMIVMLDFDKFKEINDTYGHDIGDKLLKSFANRTKKVMRKTDTFSRFGGDEFLICLVDFSCLGDMEKYALKILDVFQDPFKIKNITLQIKGSIGIAAYPDDAVTISDLIKFCDMAMYEAKKQGGNRYVFYHAIKKSKGKIGR